jgi:predicted NUDIX family NTP pyrophosphohydrolase
MPTLSAGLLLFRRKNGALEVLLVHPGGPFWANKDDAAWSVPKGVVDAGEPSLAAAKREFTEEIGAPPPEGAVISLGDVRYGNKRLSVWALEADIDVRTITSNMATIEWPPKSGVFKEFPECDSAAWFTLKTAERKLVKGQVPLIGLLAAAV